MSRLWSFPAVLLVAARLISCDRGGCEINPTPPEGTYLAVDAYPASLIGATVTVAGEDVRIQYTTADGSTWEARYKVTDAYTY